MFGGSGGDRDPFKGSSSSQDPFKDLEKIFGRMPFGPTGFPGGFSSSSSSSSSFRSFGQDGTFESVARGSFAPSATVFDSGSQYLVDLDVPGINREDLKVTATAQKLCVSGQRKAVLQNGGGGGGDQQQQQQQQKNPSNTQSFLLVDERPAGFFERCFSFPHKIIENQVTASVNNGVLSLGISHDAVPPDNSKSVTIR